MAALWVDEVSVVVHLCGHDGLDVELRRLYGSHAQTAQGRFELPSSDLEPLCALLDRRGVRWAAQWRLAPRTWGERLFAETPPGLHRTLYGALYAVLSAAGPAGRDHRALLDWAWLTRGDVSDLPRWWIVEDHGADGSEVHYDIVGRLARQSLRLSAGMVEMVYITYNHSPVQERITDDGALAQLESWRFEMGPAKAVVIASPGPPPEVVLHLPGASVRFAVDAQTGVVTGGVPAPVTDWTIWT